MAQSDQETVVQRMIDAGESEDNIAEVIRHYKTKSSDTSPQRLQTNVPPPQDNSFQGSPQFSGTETQELPAKEPDTYWGGFKKGLADYFGEMAPSVKESLQSAANPQTTGDFLNLVIPSELPHIARGGLSKIGEAVTGKASRAAEEILPEVHTASGKLDNIAEAIKREPTTQPRPPGPWDENVNVERRSPTRTQEDKIYDIARKKFGMGMDNPAFATDKPNPFTPESLAAGKQNAFTELNKPSAEFLGLNQDGTPLFNIVGGEADKSTVGLDRLKELGIEAPEIPANAKPVRGSELRRIALEERARAKENEDWGIVGRGSDPQPGDFQNLESQKPQMTPDEIADKGAENLAISELNKLKQSYGEDSEEYQQAIQELDDLMRGSNAKSVGSGRIGDSRTKLTSGEPKPRYRYNNETQQLDPVDRISEIGNSIAGQSENPTVYHGTNKSFDTFENTQNSPYSLFPKMTRFTENPEYSELYSLGETPGGMKRQMGEATGNPRTIAAKIGAQNVLDLTKPLPPEQLAEISQMFPELGENPTNDRIQDILSRNRKDIPYDAIRYSEHGQVNWAVPEKTPINTPTGLPLNEAAKPSRSARMDARNKGFRESANDMSSNPNEEMGFATQSNQPKSDLPGLDPRTQAMLDKNSQMAKMANESQKKSLWRETRDANRAVLTAYDLSAPGRQGKALMGTKAYWTSFDDMFKSWGSQNAYDNVMESIHEHPNFKDSVSPLTGKTEKSLARRAGLNIGGKEEVMNSNIAEKLIPGVKPSERAYSAFLNKLRADHFNTLVDDYKKSGVDLSKDDVKLKALGTFINDATGRGSLGKLEKAAPILNELFFAPKLAASRVNMYKKWLDPRTYGNADPIMRQQAIKSLLSTVGFGLAVGELAKLGGAQVSNDPNSSDFRKVKIGDTRIDPFSGFQQYAVGAHRLISGETANSKNPNRPYDLTSGKFGQPSRASVASNFMQNKLAPIPSLVWSWMEGRDFAGKPFEWKKALLDRTVPIVMQDLADIYKSDPKLFPQGVFKDNPTATKVGMAALPMIGEGIQTYGR